MAAKKGMKGQQIHASLYLPPESYKQLQNLSEETGVAIAVYLREAVDDLLNKYATKLKKADRKKTK